MGKLPRLLETCRRAIFHYHIHLDNITSKYKRPKYNHPDVIPDEAFPTLIRHPRKFPHQIKSD